MSKLLNIIANDLSITRYSSESDTDFIYRVCYSALALWMLKMTLSSIDNRIGISKQAQAIKIENLLQQYQRYLDLNPSCFSDNGNRAHSLSHQIRKVYEETEVCGLCDPQRTVRLTRTSDPGADRRRHVQDTPGGLRP